MAVCARRRRNWKAAGEISRANGTRSVQIFPGRGWSYPVALGNIVGSTPRDRRVLVICRVRLRMPALCLVKFFV